MNLLNGLTLQNLRLNKKRTIVTIIGIILSVALITAVLTMYKSAISSLIRFEISEKGNFHIALENVDNEKIEVIKNNRKIENIFYTKDIGYAKIESKNEYKPYVFVKAMTKDSLDNLGINLIDGRMPLNSGEILVPSHLKSNGRVVLNIGDKIKLEMGDRISDGYTLNQNNPYTIGEEFKLNGIVREYTVVGIIERPSSSIEGYSAPGYTFITYMYDYIDKDSNYSLYMRYTKSGLKDYYKITASLVGVDPIKYEKYLKMEYMEDDEEFLEELNNIKYNINENSYLVALEVNPISDSTIGGLGTTVVVVCFIIIFTSVFCIKNSFDISIAEKTRQYGMLKSVGATKKQVRRNVLFEALILGLIGIPLGIICGFVASYILIIVSNYFLVDLLNDGFQFGLKFEISWLSIGISILLGGLTIYLSALRSARRASKISPIESIRNSSDIKIKSKKMKCPKIIDKLFGIGGVLAYKNLLRNKKKYRTTVISLIVSVSVFIGLSYFMSLAFLTVKHEFKSYSYDLFLDVTKGVNNLEDNLDTLLDDGYASSYGINLVSNGYIVNPRYKKSYLDLMSKNENNNQDIIRVVSVSDKSYRDYIKKLGLKYNDIKNKGILVECNYKNYYDEENMLHDYIGDIYDYKKGDKVIYNHNEWDNTEIEIGYRTEIVPIGFDNIIDYTNVIIVSEELFNNNKFIDMEDYYRVFFISNNADNLQDELDKMYTDYEHSIYNVSENVNMMKNFYILVGIFLYGFIIVISLIGITNIFNTITTNMELRKSDFASLKSIGMTRKEFNRMINLESIFMGFKSLVYGIILGIIFTIFIYRGLGIESGFKYNLPYMSILISIIVVILLIYIIMNYSIKKIYKLNIIETIRNENI